MSENTHPERVPWWAWLCKALGWIIWSLGVLIFALTVLFEVPGSGLLSKLAWIIGGLVWTFWGRHILKQFSARLNAQRLAADQFANDKFALEVLSSVLNEKRSKPFRLYARPFVSEHECIVTKLEQTPSKDPRIVDTDTYEEESFEAHLTANLSPSLIGLAPIESGGTGLGRAVVPDVHWKKAFRALVGEAEQVFIVPSSGKNTKWEIDVLLESDDLIKKNDFPRAPSHTRTV